MDISCTNLWCGFWCFYGGGGFFVCVWFFGGLGGLFGFGFFGGVLCVFLFGFF